MSKFNGFENHILRDAINAYIEDAELQVEKAQVKGRSTLFAPGYFTMISKELLAKIDVNTNKKYIKERDKKI
jgi:hypothetical protein